MEELNTKPVVASLNETKERKPYTPPAADIILLTPKEELFAWDYNYHDSDRWALNKWNVLKETNDPASGMVGTVCNPDNTWKLQ